jgi:cysteine desulfurase / selenocysteine lyase
MQATQTIDIQRIRQDFPTLQQQVHGKDLVYFDNAATSQTPQVVIDRLKQYYELENSNVHRGVHYLSQLATSQYEAPRKLTQQLLNAAHEHEIIYTKGTTDGINLVAQSYGRKYFQAGDEILLSEMEHHSNIVPWQLVAEQTGAVIKVIPVTDAGELDLEAYQDLLSEKTAMVGLVHISNSLGTINPVKEMTAAAHAVGAKVLIDGAQATPHMKVDVQDLDADFYVFSAHKIFGPTGIGILYGKEALLESMPPYQGGGDMIKVVRFEGTTYNDLPHKFEAGTPNIADGIAFGTALEYVHQIGYEAMGAWEKELLDYATERLSEIPDLRIIGTAQEKASVISFLIGDIHPYDGGTILDQLGIAVRTGHHCCQPLMHRYGIPGTMRASFAFYNTKEEIDRLVEGIHRVRKMFGQA